MTISLRSYLVAIAASTALCFAAWLLVIFFINPTASTTLGLTVFYISLFFTLVGALTLIGFYVRVWLSKNEIIYEHVGTAFRQSILLSIVVIGGLIMQAYRVLTWWDALLFVVSVSLLEFYFLTRT